MVSFSIPVPSEIAALLTRISQRPCFASIFDASAATLESSPMSTMMPQAVPPAALILAAAPLATASLMSAMTTCAPSSARRRAMPKPMPWAPPVTTATRPSNRLADRSVIWLLPKHAGLSARAPKARGPERAGSSHAVLLHHIPIDFDAEAGLFRQRDRAVWAELQFLMRQLSSQAFHAELRRQVFDEGTVV